MDSSSTRRLSCLAAPIAAPGRAGLAGDAVERAEPADRIYVVGAIVTADARDRVAEALAIRECGLRDPLAVPPEEMGEIEIGTVFEGRSHPIER